MVIISLSKTTIFDCIQLDSAAAAAINRCADGMANGHSLATTESQQTIYSVNYQQQGGGDVEDDPFICAQFTLELSKNNKKKEEIKVLIDFLQTNITDSYNEI